MAGLCARCEREHENGRCSRRHGSWSHAEFLRAEEFRRRLEAEDAAETTESEATR